MKTRQDALSEVHRLGWLWRGIFVQHGSLVMNSGTLKSNGSGSGFSKVQGQLLCDEWRPDHEKQTSAVAVNARILSMTGGKITGNSADHGTGGIYGWGSAKIVLRAERSSGIVVIRVQAFMYKAGWTLPEAGSVITKQVITEAASICGMASVICPVVKYPAIQPPMPIQTGAVAALICIMGHPICNRRNHHREYHRQCRRRYPCRCRKYCSL